MMIELSVVKCFTPLCLMPSKVGLFKNFSLKIVRLVEYEYSKEYYKSQWNTVGHMAEIWGKQAYWIS